MNTNQHIVMFDGYCNLCSGVVQFIIKKERNAVFKFSSLQSSFAKELLQNAPEKIQQSDAIIYYKNGKFYHKSSAVLLIALHLKFPYSLLIIFWMIPFFIRDFFYDIIAKYRYKWFGKKDSCMIPSDALKNRFLE